jgi:hypothetical protein
MGDISRMTSPQAHNLRVKKSHLLRRALRRWLDKKAAALQIILPSQVGGAPGVDSVVMESAPDVVMESAPETAEVETEAGMAEAARCVVSALLGDRMSVQAHQERAKPVEAAGLRAEEADVESPGGHKGGTESGGGKDGVEQLRRRSKRERHAKTFFGD